MPFAQDGTITYEVFISRFNSDLANTLGNLVNRTISMTNKYFGGVVTDKGVAETEEEKAVDADLKAVTEDTPKRVDAKMDELRVADAITEIFVLFKRCNKYIDETMPWALAKDEAKKDRLEEVLYNLVESITIGACMERDFSIYSIFLLIHQQISAPAGIAFSGVMRHTLPSASSAQRSIPSDIMPASLAGFRLVRTITFIPMVSSGL